MEHESHRQWHKDDMLPEYRAKATHVSAVDDVHRMFVQSRYTMRQNSWTRQQHALARCTAVHLALSSQKTEKLGAEMLRCCTNCDLSSLDCFQWQNWTLYTRSNNPFIRTVMLILITIMVTIKHSYQQKHKQSTLPI